MNFGEMKTEVFRIIAENSSAPVFWTAADVARAVNDGYEEISDASEWYERQATLNLNGQTYLNLETAIAETFVAPLRVYNPATTRWLEPDDVRSLDDEYRRWEVTTGPPDRYFMRGLWFLGMFPKSSTGTLQLWFSSIPPAMASDSDRPDFPQEIHWGLVDYAVYDLLCQEAETEKALRFWKSYLKHQRELVQYVQHRISVDRVRSLG